ncbi:hypothetical protein THASP1DRAFT_32451 [Thamnocephalis sphaerospora]|uniref:Uncharacterized protein n=1 Tax=Thamnocephalis sphaerospora TaxID=78915 RepID=A0A4V1IVY8_9FUNG|nr:hypothetical protein THASP1DRAFT_32451 [Thamnocephalis sphaerospora]|eukprot:RKP05709.1 hypothetical protein THASP1DRAFT_32451 [Thamnocephalis sphaerospora]
MAALQSTPQQTPDASQPQANGAVTVAALEQRMRQLERRLLARNPATGVAPLADEAPEVAALALAAAAPAAAPADADATDATTSAVYTLLERVPVLQDRMRDQVAHRQALSDALEKYAACRSYLALSDTSPPAETSETSSAPNASTTAVFERNALTVDAKAHLLAEVAPEWLRTQALLEEAREAQTALNPPEFQQVQSLAPRLEAVSAVSAAQDKRAEAANGKLDALLAEYNDTVQTLSQLFIHWDRLLEDLDARVRVAERRAQV